MKQVSQYKLLCISSRYALFCKENQLFYTPETKFTPYEYIGKLPIEGKKRIIPKNRICTRLFRLEPRCAIFIKRDVAIVSFLGKAYRVEIEKKKIVVEHTFRKSMNNPLVFSKISGIEGFEDGILYGEYFGNGSFEPVNIFQRNCLGEWFIVYTFDRNEIRHIHRILPCPHRNSVIVLTGDYDDQSMIIEFKDNFKKKEVLLQGKQSFRSCVAFPYMNGIVYATDTPLEKNCIYYYDFNRKDVNRICSISGPCIYGTKLCDDLFVFSTSIEPDSNLSGWRYRLSYRLGPGVRDWYSHVYFGNPSIGFSEIEKSKKDILPMLLFGFGTFQFPCGQDMHDKRVVYLTAQSLSGKDGKTFCIVTEQED